MRRVGLLEGSGPEGVYGGVAGGHDGDVVQGAEAHGVAGSPGWRCPCAGSGRRWGGWTGAVRSLGSLRNTSRPAAARWLDWRASIRASSSTKVPRAAFTRTAPWGRRARVSRFIRRSVAAPPGAWRDRIWLRGRRSRRLGTHSAPCFQVRGGAGNVGVEDAHVEAPGALGHRAADAAEAYDS